MVNVSQILDQAIQEASESHTGSDVADKIINEMSKLTGQPIEKLKNSLPSHLRGREPGFHASSAGYCLRKVLTEVLNPEYPYPEDREKYRIFALGKMFHSFLHEALSARLWRENGQVVLLQPMRLESFRDDETGFVVVGEPDEIVLDWRNREIHIIDGKTAGYGSFSNMLRVKKTGQPYYSMHHKLQVGTYMAALKQIFGDEFTYIGHICYLDKDKLKTLNPILGERLDLEAWMYWKEVKRAWLKALETGEMPEASPMMGWECGYCPIHKHTLKSPQSRKKHALDKCKRVGSYQLLNNTTSEENSSPGDALDLHANAKEMLG